MNVIWGAIHFNGNPINPDFIHKIQHVFSHHPADHAAYRYIDPVLLGCRVQRLTPESAQEELPYFHGSSDTCITAVSRLDNRDELCRLLDIFPPDQSQIPDSQLILQAYERWGDACPEKLLGDFAFAIWDKRSQTLMCATDHMGVNPLYYAWIDGLFVFASEIKGLLAAGVPAELNGAKIAAMPFLSLHFSDKASTFYKQIYRLPKATVISVRADGIHEQTYWHPAPASGLHFKSDTDWLEAFKEVFFKTIAARMCADKPVAALLSGGLDSSSVVAVAAQILKEKNRSLQVISAVSSPDLMTDIRDEQPYINQFRTWDNIDIEYITDEQRGPFDNLERLVWGAESPMITSRHYLYGAFVDAARRHQAPVLLDGIGGELGPTCAGPGYLAELMMKGRLLRLYREAKMRTVRYDTSLHNIIRWGLVNPIMPDGVKRLLARKGRRDFEQRLHHFPVKRAFTDIYYRDELPELVAKTCALGEVYPNHRANQRRNIEITQCAGLTAFLGYEHITWAYPFYDKRLLEFCLAVPGRLKVRDGYTRFLVRAGLDGILPRKIQWRTTKEPFSVDFHIRYNRQRSEIEEMLRSITKSDPINEIVDVDALIAMAQHEMTDNRDQTPGNYAAMHLVPMGVYLIYFLRQFDEYKAA